MNNRFDDKSFTNLFSAVIGAWALIVVCIIGFWGFIIWAIYKIMQHFGII